MDHPVTTPRDDLPHQPPSAPLDTLASISWPLHVLSPSHPSSRQKQRRLSRHDQRSAPLPCGPHTLTHPKLCGPHSNPHPNPTLPPTASPGKSPKLALTQPYSPPSPAASRMQPQPGAAYNPAPTQSQNLAIPQP